MSMIATDLKDLFKISIKTRHDTYTDQYNRIFMVKILLACTVILGISWYSDKFNCIVPETQASYEEFQDFVSTTCWIQGMYIYKEMRDKVDQVSYYGIPKDTDSDGLLDDKYNCRVNDKFHQIPNTQCKEMTKIFYIQYQYMPFYVCTLALLYFLPYMVYKTINNDLINLRETIKKGDVNVDNIVKHYFKERKQRRGIKTLTVRQVVNILVKIGYIVVNMVAFFGTDSVLNGEFYRYGGKLIDWSKKNGTQAFDYLGTRKLPKPGNELLPPFGYCELYSSAKDVKTTFTDKHKVVCEISQHILYQYVFMLLWFAIVIGMVVSIIGLILLLVKYILEICHIGSNSSKKIFRVLTYREIEYLEFLHKKNVPVYGEVLDKLRERILGSPAESVGSSYDHPPKSELPMYPSKGRSPNGPYAL